MKRFLSVLFLSLPWIAVALIVGALVLRRFPLSGSVQFSFPFDGKSPWFDPFLPAERVISPGLQADGWVGQRVLQDPVYASARVPGPFDRVSLEFEARVHDQPFLEFGLLRDPNTFAFEMVPFWSQAFEAGWRPVSGRGLQGLVREDLPDETLWTAKPEEMLVWRATSPALLLQDEPGPEERVPISLRGPHDFFLVPAGGRVDMRFWIQNMNRSRGGNRVVFRLEKNGEILWTDAVAVGGTRDRTPEAVYEKDIQIPSLSPGVYRLSVLGDENIFIRQISTHLRHWVVGPRVWFGDEIGYSTSTPSVRAWTNSRHLLLDTVHPEGIQIASLGSAVVKIHKTHTTFALDRLPGELAKNEAVLVFPLGDVRLTGDGFVALVPGALFLPAPRRFTDASRLKEEGIKAVLTPYRLPEKTSDDWVRLIASFVLPDAQDRPKFTLSAPGIEARGGAVDIRSVQLRFTRPALSGKEWRRALRRELVAAWRRL